MNTSLSPTGWQQAQLGLGVGGLGLRSARAHAEAAFVGCLAENRWVDRDVKMALFAHAGINWDNALSNQSQRSSVVDQQLLADLMQVVSETDKRRLQSVGSPRANGWLLAYPNRLLGMEFTDQAFRVECLRWLGEPLQPDCSNCGSCARPMSPRASHATRCKTGGDLIRRHNEVASVFFHICESAHMHPVREKAGLLGDAPGLRPADVFLPNVFDGRDVAIDFAVTDPLQPSYAKKLKVGESAAEYYAAQYKHAKYDKGFEGTNITFCAAVMDTFGAWCAEGEQIVKLGIQRAASRVAPHNAGQYKALCWQRISCALHRAVAKAILARLQWTGEEDDGMLDAVAF